MDHPTLQRAVETLIRAVGATVNDDHPAFLAIVVPLSSPTTTLNPSGTTEPAETQSAPTSTGTGSVPDLLTVKDVAAILQCSPSKVKKIVADATLPSVHIGRLRRIRRSDLDGYLNNLA